VAHVASSLHDYPWTYDEQSVAREYAICECELQNLARVPGERWSSALQMIQKHVSTALWLIATVSVVLLTFVQPRPGCHVLLDRCGNVAGYTCIPAGGQFFIAGAVASAMLPPITLLLLTRRKRVSFSTIFRFVTFVGASAAYMWTDIIALGTMGVLIVVGRCVLLWIAIIGISAGICSLSHFVLKTVDVVVAQELRDCQH
jgi:hypothetical protein